MDNSRSRFRQSLPVMELFYTIQGEGKFTGIRLFHRFRCCDVGCVWCDVKKKAGEAGNGHFISRKNSDEACIIRKIGCDHSGEALALMM